MQRWPTEELKTPVIYGVHPVESANAGNQNMVALISSLVRSRNVVAGLHLDHSPSFDKVVEFIRDGYTSAMVEGSTLPLGQNLQLTRDAVRVARPAGVSVEAEVGTIGTTAEYGAEIENPHLADPAGCEAMGETGIDALAVAIGNAHGFYIAEPKLDLDLLAEVRRRIEVPLVLNGGSGIPVDQVQKAIGMGVAKMNVGTAIHVAFKERMEQGLANPRSHDIMKIVSGCQPRAMEEQLLRGGWSSPMARKVTEGHSQCSPNAGGQIAVLLPEELPQLSPPAARVLLRLLHNVAESDGRGAPGSTRAA